MGFFLHFYFVMAPFWLQLNFYVCIPWVNKLPVTFEKQIPLNKLKSKVVKRYSYQNCRASKRKIQENGVLWECNRMLDQLHWKQVIHFSTLTFWVQFYPSGKLLCKILSLPCITSSHYHHFFGRILVNTSLTTILDTKCLSCVHCAQFLFYAKEFPHLSLCLQKWA